MNNIDVEYYLMASAIHAPKLWIEVNFVYPEDFTDSFCAVVWGELQNRFAEGKSFDARLVVDAVFDEPDRRDALKTIIDWVSNIGYAGNGADYARHVKDLSTRRKIIAASEEIIAKAKDYSIQADEVAGFGIGALNETTNDFCEFIDAYKIGEQIEKDLLKEVECYSTGFKRLDEALAGGLYKGRFYGLAARMKSGKSLLMSTIAYSMAFSSARVLYLCLEMGAQESFQRVLSMHMGINSLDFLKPERRNAQWFRNKLASAVAAFRENNRLVYRARPRMTLDDLKSTIAKAGISGKYDGIIVDYLQLVEGKPKGQSSSEHYDNVAQTLAEAVKRYPIWIMAAAQLNRDGNIRGSDGMLMACDASFSINKLEGGLYGDGTRIPDRAWLEMTTSRYTPFANIGSQEVPAYEIDYESGPRFVELK